MFLFFKVSAAPQIQRRASGSAKKYQMSVGMRTNGTTTTQIEENGTQSAPSSPLKLLKRICLCGHEKDHLDAHERARRVS